ncbi:hypothetical protein LPB140_02655 [Sphingorhabdus lutea]|uniref:Glutathione S-transferase n=1 Tax=Sphingorhabdus lutea TaxID=1913578 RepID=A0A1L3J9V5_9SPHN|nr:glutathione S-transferase family protein [Sphingorhabdus lutea]APG61905.1 hypothetical protein LPB140_02655 [Sphingorhabdus lutea]
MTIKLHHLGYSRSTRIIWLLEEAGIEYELIEHHRNPATNRSQDDLKAVHPLAKAPAVEVDGRTMVESSAIIEYLLETRGDGKLSVAAGQSDRSAYLEWLHFAEGTVAMPILLKLLGPRFGGLGDVQQAFVDGEVHKLLDYINAHLDGRQYLVGDGLTGADINMEYLLELANLVGLLENRPHAKAYVNRLMARPGYKKAIEIGGPLTPPMAK